MRLFTTFIFVIALFSGCSAHGFAQEVGLPPKGAPIDVQFSEFLPGRHDETDGVRLLQSLSRMETRPFGSFRERFFAFDRLWLKIRINNPTSEDVSLVLVSCTPTYSQWLISAQEGGKVLWQKSGYAENQPLAKVLEAAIPIKVSPGTTTYFIGRSSPYLPNFPAIKLWREADYRYFQDKEVIVTMLAMGSVGACIAFVLIFMLWLRSIIFVYVSLSAFIMYPLIMVLKGPAYFLPVTMRCHLFHCWLPLTVLAGVFMTFFARKFLGIDDGKYPRLDLTLRILSIFGIGLLPLYFVFTRMVTLGGLSTVGVLISLVLIFAIKKVLFERDLEALFYIAGFLPVTLADCFAIAEGGGFLSYNPLYIDMQLAGMVIACLILPMPMGNKVLVERQMLNHIKQSLKGVIADHRIHEIAQQGLQLLRTPTKQQVSILFIDIVGYSLIFKRMNSQDAFFAVKQVLSDMTAIVHRHGGVIDKSLGDGLMAFFGYDLVGRTIEGHEQIALRCAIEIQRHLLQSRVDAGEEIFPLRIGINSAEVNIGNMGNEHRIDVTISGSGVVLASRFEWACEPFKIILGDSIYTKLSPPLVDLAGFSEILVPVKHMTDLISAYEFDPFMDKAALLKKGRSIFRQHNLLRVKHERYPIEREITVESSWGTMQLINFSLGGFNLRSQRRLAKGVVMEIFFRFTKEHVAADWLTPVPVEVVWGAKGANGAHTLGVRLVGANSKQRSAIFGFIRQMNDADAPPSLSAAS